jgi:2-oxoglutarate ferredoxin oxidoreductase subunit gamma
VISTTWAALILHPEFAAPVWAALRSDGLALVNSSVVDSVPADPGARIIQLEASDIAIELGNIVCASMVLVGAYAAITELVTPAGLEAGVLTAIPPYRRQHVDLNLAALEAGRNAALELTP